MTLTFSLRKNLLNKWVNIFACRTKQVPVLRRIRVVMRLLLAVVNRETKYGARGTQSQYASCADSIPNESN